MIGHIPRHQTGNRKRGPAQQDIPQMMHLFAARDPANLGLGAGGHADEHRIRAFVLDDLARSGPATIARLGNTRRLRAGTPRQIGDPGGPRICRPRHVAPATDQRAVDARKCIHAVDTGTGGIDHDLWPDGAAFALWPAQMHGAVDRVFDMGAVQRNRGGLRRDTVLDRFRDQPLGGGDGCVMVASDSHDGGVQGRDTGQGVRVWRRPSIL